MTLEELRHFFAWGAVLNYVVLILWVVLTLTAPTLMLELCRKLFRISEETYYKANFYGIMFYKLGILLLFLMPYITLRLFK